MSFMDKVKAQAEQAVTKAQAGMAQGQAKIDTMQASRQHAELERTLGAAYYAQLREGGSADAVTAALAALDQAGAAQGPADSGPSPTPSAGSPQPGTPQPGTPQPGTTEGDFTL